MELGLLAPVLSTLMLAAAQLGWVAYQQIEVSNAARAGVAYGAQNSTTAQDTAGMKAAALNDGADVSSGSSNTKTLAATATLVCTCSDGTSVTCATVAAKCVNAGAHTVDYVQVNTSATVTPVIHVPGFATSYSLTGQAIMRVSQ